MDLNAPLPTDRELRSLLARHSALAESTDIVVRRSAYEALYELTYKTRAKAQVAVPVLLRGLADLDEKIGESCVYALAHCQPASLSGLLEALLHSAAFVRERAAHALGNIGDDARVAASEALRMCLSDPEPAVRSRAAWSLGLIHDDAPTTLASLGRLAGTGTVSDRSASLHALGTIGRALDESQPLSDHKDVIISALTDSDADVRWSALYASEGLNIGADDRVALLADLLAGETNERVLTAILHQLGPLATHVAITSVEPRLIALLPLRGLTRSVCEVLETMRPKPMEASKALLALLEDDEHLLAAGRALVRITGNAAPVVAALARLPALDEGECDLVCEFGPAAAALVPRLIEAMADESWDLQWAAADALNAVAGQAADAVPVLMEALGHPSLIVRSAAGRALAQVGAAALEPLRAVVREYADPRLPWAAYALENMGPVAVPALPDLREGLRCAQPLVERACAFAVSRLAGDASTVPVLVSALLDHDPQAPRRAAAEALGSLGPSAKAAVRPLRKMLKDSDPEVVEAARQALGSILGSAH